MITFIAFLLIFCSGYVFATAIDKKIPMEQRIALGFPLGFGFITILMVLLNFVLPRFNIWILLTISVSTAILLIFLKIKTVPFIESCKIKKQDLPDFKQVNLSWLLMLGVLAYIIYAIIAKTLFWPPVAYDTITGYDYMAKVVGAEGCFNNSIFDINNATNSIRHSYPPFVPGTYSIPYMLGLDSSKISLVCLILSLLFLTWSLLKSYTKHHTLGLFFLVVLFTTPEFLAMSALSLTNIPQTIFASSGLIYLFFYIDKNKFNYLILASILLGLNIWTRFDGIVFIFGGGVMLAIHFLQKKDFKSFSNYKPIIVFLLISISPVFLWKLFTSTHIPNIYSSSEAFHKGIFLDKEQFKAVFGAAKRIISSTQLFGYTFIIIAVGLLLNIKNIFKDKAILLAGVVAAFILYFLLYYQMYYESKGFNYTVDGMFNASFKRGMFPFLPVFLFYVATSKSLNNLFSRFLNIKLI